MKDRWSSKSSFFVKVGEFVSQMFLFLHETCRWQKWPTFWGGLQWTVKKPEALEVRQQTGWKGNAWVGLDSYFSGGGKSLTQKSAGFTKFKVMNLL